MAPPRLANFLLDNIKKTAKAFNAVVEYDNSDIVKIGDLYYVSWLGYDFSAIKGGYRSEYLGIKDYQRYSLRLRNPRDDSDVSFIQLIYVINDQNEILDGTRLAYYPYIPTHKEYDDFVVSSFANYSNLRIEVSSKQHAPYVHPVVHLQFGSLNDFRIPVSGFPCPFDFVNVIFQSFYSQDWTGAFINGGQVNKTLFNSLRLGGIPLLDAKYLNELPYSLHLKV